jgi:phosphoglycolate phosphatase
MADHDAALFDLDGVLVDSRVPFARGVNSALASHGLAARPEHELRRYLGPPLHRAFRALAGEESLVQPCVDSYRARYRELAASETTVFPGIRAILDELTEHLPLVVATSKPRALAEPLLGRIGPSGSYSQASNSIRFPQGSSQKNRRVPVSASSHRTVRPAPDRRSAISSNLPGWTRSAG